MLSKLRDWLARQKRRAAERFINLTPAEKQYLRQIYEQQLADLDDDPECQHDCEHCQNH